MAMELCLFDSMPKDLPPFLRGFTAALISTTACYPLDTIRCVFLTIELHPSGTFAGLPRILASATCCTGACSPFARWKVSK